MADKKKKTSDKVVEVNPTLDVDPRTIRTEAVEQINEILSRLGRMKLSRAMFRAAESGKLERARKRKDRMAMTVGRATGLGWRGARRQIKQGIAGGKDLSTLDPVARARIETIANRKKMKQQILAKKIKMLRLRGESVDNLNRAFELMTEGKRYHQLMKDGKVKFDRRFKMFKNKAETKVTEETIGSLFESFYDNITETNLNAAKLALDFMLENESDVPMLEHAHAVAKSFGVSVKDLMEE